MNCEICNKSFDLVNNIPLLLPCCGNTACKECLTKLPEEPQQTLFTCPMKDCQEQNQDQSDLKTNKIVEKILNQANGILCDQHPQYQGEFYCKEHQKFVCTTCLIKNHHHLCIQIDKQELISYNDKLLRLLQVEHDRIHQLINEIKSYQQNEKQFTSQQYMKLIKDSQEIISLRLNHQDIKQIAFPPNKQALQKSIEKEEKKIPEVSELYHDNNSISNLITEPDFQLLKSYLKTDNLQLKLLYMGSDHGFKVKDFHDRCDNKGPTLTVAKSQCDEIFGGFATVSWESVKQYKKDKEAFLFSLTKKSKLIQYQNEDKAVRHDKTYGPSFGGWN